MSDAPWGTALCRAAVARLAAMGDVTLGGDRPWDLRVHDDRAYRRFLVEGTVGFGDSYVEGWWRCDDVEEMAVRLASTGLDEVMAAVPWALRGGGLAARWLNPQSRRGALEVAERHYNLGNDLFLAFLGRHKVYSCGYFRGTDDLDVAQSQKLDLICRKLDLRPGARLLDVGGGWGELAKHAAQHYGARVTSVNISDAQIEFAREHCRGLDVDVVRCDYRDVTGVYDRVAAIAMFTHVGRKNYRAFMTSMRRALAPDGVFVMEGIWGNTSKTHTDPWIDKNIFPNGMMPSGAQTFRAFEGLFVAEDLHNFGPDYVSTLRAWKRNLADAWPTLSRRYSERVRRMFDFYFSVSAAYFRLRATQNWQIVLTPPGRAQPDARRS